MVAITITKIFTEYLFVIYVLL